MASCGSRQTVPTQYPGASPFSEINAVVDYGRGTVVVAMARQLAQLVDGTLEPFPVDDDLQEVKLTSLLRDRRGGLWIGTQDNGLLHLHDGRTHRLGRVEGLSGTAVVDIFEDRSSPRRCSGPPSGSSSSGHVLDASRRVGGQ